jgi:hypothetical protein
MPSRPARRTKINSSHPVLTGRLHPEDDSEIEDDEQTDPEDDQDHSNDSVFSKW